MASVCSHRSVNPWRCLDLYGPSVRGAVFLHNGESQKERHAVISLDRTALKNDSFLFV